MSSVQDLQAGIQLKETMMAEELKKCPFCGGKAISFCFLNNIDIEIRCEDCRIVMSAKFVPDLSKAWNTRK